MINMAANDTARQLLQCTVRIDTEAGGGTGFITGDGRNGMNDLSLVTNRHVVTGADRMRLAFLTAPGGQSPRGPEKAIVHVSNVQRNCVFHEDPSVDIAALPFGTIANKYSKAGMQLLFTTIPPDIYLTEPKSREMSAIEEVIIIGYPRLLRDEHTLAPIVRRGITATPMDQRFRGLRGFLVDAAVFEGSSGSPVFIYNAGAYPTPNGITIGRRLVFLGILARLVSGLDYSPLARRKGAGAPCVPGGVPEAGDVDLAMSKYTNLGLVFTAQCVHEAVTRMMTEGGA